MIAGRGVRAVRAAVFAAVCVLLATIGHVLMSKAGLPWWAPVAGVTVTGAAAWCLAGREYGLLPVVAFALVAQSALHTAFSLSQTAVEPAQPVHHHHAGSAMQSMASMAPTSHDMSDMSSTGMLAAHLLAALLSGLWLAYGERAAFRILRAVAGWLVAPLCLPVRVPAMPHRPRVRPRRNRATRTPRQRLLVHVLTSRGPPAGTAVV
ncbi:hypothetical protein ACH492_34790 [Streptomyces sp. NPDC019443]|uniref:hypothetical protein n=1 Tax=Streptomyces sp. NPDC019443 TaxID=3365061 RepID=UPI003790F1A8